MRNDNLNLGVDDQLVWVDSVMKAFRFLSANQKTSQLPEAFSRYFDAINEAEALEMVTGIEKEKSPLSSLPDVNGLLRWAVVQNLPRLVKLCIERDADVQWHANWAVVYAITHEYNEVAELLIENGASIDDAINGILGVKSGEPFDFKKVTPKEVKHKTILDCLRSYKKSHACDEVKDEWGPIEVPEIKEQVLLAI